MRITQLIIVLILAGLQSISCGISIENVPKENIANSNFNSEKGKKEIQPLNLCELLADASRFDKKEVEVSAILITGFEYSYLYDPNCRGKKEYELWYRIKNNDVNEKLDSIINTENSEYKEVGLIRVKADFTGNFIMKNEKGFGPGGYYIYKLEILDIKNISLVAKDIPYPWQPISGAK